MTQDVTPEYEMWASRYREEQQQDQQVQHLRILVDRHFNPAPASPLAKVLIGVPVLVGLVIGVVLWLR
jgi:hypothetical protein